MAEFTPMFIAAEEIKRGDTIQVVSAPVVVHSIYPPGENYSDEISFQSRGYNNIDVPTEASDPRRIVLLHREDV